MVNYISNKELNYLEKHRPIKLEYLIKRKEIEIENNNLLSYMRYNSDTEIHPIRTMRWKLEELDAEYLSKIEQEEACLFDNNELKDIYTN